MRNTDVKYVRITVEVTRDCWKELKMRSIMNDCNLQNIVQDILERSAQKKTKGISSNEEN